MSTVAIDNLRAADTLTINTNDGADIVGIERGSSVERFVGNALITKLATFQTGVGNDIVLIGYLSAASNVGPADSTRVRFLSGLTVDGGTGTNTRNNYVTENDITGTPTISNFSAITAP